jgi:dephospho-CoA kinase
MLRVGLTGGLASGKSTVAALLRELGADLIEADELGRQLMEPGQIAYQGIVEYFGASVLLPDGHLDRRRLAELAFAEGRLQELNAIVHPVVIRAQQAWMQQVFEKNPQAVAVVESALIFEVARDAKARGERTGLLADMRARLDRVIVVTAPEAVRVARYVARVCPTGEGCEAARADALRRLAHQISDAEKAALADEVIENIGNLDDLRRKVTTVWERLKADSN